MNRDFRRWKREKRQNTGYISISRAARRLGLTQDETLARLRANGAKISVVHATRYVRADEVERICETIKD
jgi:tRNA U34 5-carboxymethylaminomethyl modifying enzyme MnmG/GidA